MVAHRANVDAGRWTPARRREGNCLSPNSSALNAGAFVIDDQAERTVDLAAHRGEPTLDDLEPAGDEPNAAAA